MLRNSFSYVPMSPRKFPERPSDVGREEEIKSNPGVFALALSEHAGFNDGITARTMTPPPQYTRHEQPRLTIVIPEDVDEMEEEDPNSSSSIEPAQDEIDVPSTETSPVVVSPSKQSESKLFLKVKAEVRRRGKGLRSKLRRSTGSSPSSPLQSSPSSPLRPTDSDVASSEQQDWPLAGPSQQSPSIPELDGRQISTQSLSTVEEQGQFGILNVHHMQQGHVQFTSFDGGVQRNASVSSIIPTPRRGLSLASPPSRQRAGIANVNSAELTGRLESLYNKNRRRQEENVMSPCSPASPNAETSRAWSSLMRSNAVTDRVSGIFEPISPLSPMPGSPSPPPSTPTLEGRLGGLPRLNVTNPQLHNRQRNEQAPMTRIPQMPAPRRQLAELDCGKELVTSSDQVATNGWYIAPGGSLNMNQPHGGVQHIPSIAIDHADNAPEVFHNHSHRGPSRGNNMGREMSSQWSPQLFTGRPYQSRSPLAALTGSLWDAVISGITQSSDLLRQAYGPEPLVPEGHVRVRWRCTCGEHVYDDYIENRQGAAAELEAYLNKVPNQWPNSPPTSHPSSAADSIFSADSNQSPLSSATSWSSQVSQSPTLWDQHGVAKQQMRVASGNPYSMGLKSYIDPLWLYTCVNEGKWTTKMRHLDVNNSKINSDKDLALALGALHNQVNRKWYKLFKLRGLISIKFVQFELHRNRYADISKTPALPTPGNTNYEFAPHELTPPVGSNYLMHLFKHPYDYDDELITYLRTPKRRDRLEMGTGWGLQLVEGFLPERVWAAVLVLAVIGSAVFAGCWARGKGDVQGAFGVAGWIVGIAGLVGAWVQAVFD